MAQLRVGAGLLLRCGAVFGCSRVGGDPQCSGVGRKRSRATGKWHHDQHRCAFACRGPERRQGSVVAGRADTAWPCSATAPWASPGGSSATELELVQKPVTPPLRRRPGYEVPCSTAPVQVKGPFRSHRDRLWITARLGATERRNGHGLGRQTATDSSATAPNPTATCPSR